MPSLVSLYLDNNVLAGEVPASLGALVSLNHLSASNNRISGAFPELANVTQLLHLDLSKNMLEAFLWPVAAPLTHLDLSDNRLSGSMPTINTEDMVY